jgi:CRP-like cAMP-binding protein
MVLTMTSRASSAFLALLSEEDRAAFEVLGRLRRYDPGRVLILEGEHVGHVLLLLDGRVKVTSMTADGRELLLSVCGPGEIMGELAALGGERQPCSATVTTLDPVRAQVVPTKEFLDYVERHPKALLILTRAIIERLRAADRRRLEFGSYDAPGRVARLLVEMAEEHGRTTVAGIEIGLPLSQEELAGLITASRESVARSLTSLRRRGLITTGRRSVTVCDMDALRRLAV